MIFLAIFWDLSPHELQRAPPPPQSWRSVAPSMLNSKIAKNIFYLLCVAYMLCNVLGATDLHDWGGEEGALREEIAKNIIYFPMCSLHAIQHTVLYITFRSRS